MSEVEQPVRHGPCRGCGDEHPITEVKEAVFRPGLGFIDCPVKSTSYLVEINGEPLKGYLEAVEAMRSG